MPKVTDFLHRAANGKKRSSKPTMEEPVAITTPPATEQPWLTRRLETIVTIVVIAAIIIFYLVTFLVAKGYLDWRFDRSASSHETAIETVAEETVEVAVAEPSFSGEYVLEGTMQGVGKIKMTIYISGDNVTGTYGYYKTGLKPIKLSGTIDRQGSTAHLTLNECDEYDNAYACFVGTFDGTTFSGSFNNYYTERAYTFELNAL